MDGHRNRGDIMKKIMFGLLIIVFLISILSCCIGDDDNDDPEREEYYMGARIEYQYGNHNATKDIIVGRIENDNNLSLTKSDDYNIIFGFDDLDSNIVGVIVLTDGELSNSLGIRCEYNRDSYIPKSKESEFNQAYINDKLKLNETIPYIDTILTNLTETDNPTISYEKIISFEEDD